MLDHIEAFADKHNMFPDGGLILAAVSGGADSVCLLAALVELAVTRNFSIECVHFNHQLRGTESERDAQFVAGLCRKLDVPLHSGTGNVESFASENGFGLEDAARRLRYGFFNETAKKTGAARIVTAHTADDNAETVLLHLTRGTGLNGLGGIPPVRDAIIRPMLTVTRADVIRFLNERSLSFVEDSSNEQDIFNRNKIRHHVIPVLKSINPRLASTITAATAHLREDEAYLSGLAHQFIAENRNGTTLSAVSKLAALPNPVASRVIKVFTDINLSSKHLTSVLDLCRSKNVSGAVMLPTGTVLREYDRLIFPADWQAEGFEPITLVVGMQVSIPELGLTVRCREMVCGEKINKSFTTFLFKYDKICDKIVIRSRETGDNIELFGHRGTKTLKKLFIEKRIPMRKRPLIPIVTDSSGVLAVCSLGFDKRAACKSGDRALEITFEETAHEK